MYVNEIPKTSPSSRNGIEDMYYRIAQGKAALLQRKRASRAQAQEDPKAPRAGSQQEEDQKPKNLRYQMYQKHRVASQDEQLPSIVNRDGLPAILRSESRGQPAGVRELAHIQQRGAPSVELRRVRSKEALPQLRNNLRNVYHNMMVGD